jgi:hypothetical protein
MGSPDVCIAAFDFGLRDFIFLRRFKNARLSANMGENYFRRYIGKYVMRVGGQICKTQSKRYQICFACVVREKRDYKNQFDLRSLHPVFA